METGIKEQDDYKIIEPSKLEKTSTIKSKPCQTHH